MSQQKQLEQVLDLLLSENTDKASEILHKIIVEKARSIYEEIIREEEVGDDPESDFTDEISSDEEEIETDELNDGEAESFDGEDEESEDGESDDAESDVEGDAEGEGDIEDRVDDLESELSSLRAEFDALMGEEMQEPEHADLGAEDEFGAEDDMGSEDEMFTNEDDMQPAVSDNTEQVVGEVVAKMYEKKAAAKAVEPKTAKLEVAKQKKDVKKDKKVDEETKFATTVADTGQKGTAKLTGTGKGSTLGAEQTKSPYTNAPTRKDYGGSSKNILGSKATGGEYGSYNGDTPSKKTVSDNTGVKPKSVSTKADTTAKYTGGAVAGEGFTKSPLSKKPA